MISTLIVKSYILFLFNIVMTSQEEVFKFLDELKQKSNIEEVVFADMDIIKKFNVGEKEANDFLEKWLEINYDKQN